MSYQLGGARGIQNNNSKNREYGGSTPGVPRGRFQIVFTKEGQGRLPRRGKKHKHFCESNRCWLCVLLTSILLPYDSDPGTTSLSACSVNCLLAVCIRQVPTLLCPSVSVVQAEDQPSAPSVGGGAHSKGSCRSAPHHGRRPTGKTRPSGSPVLFQGKSEQSDRSDWQMVWGGGYPSPDCHSGPRQDKGNMDYACGSPHVVLPGGQSPHSAPKGADSDAPPQQRSE